MDRAFYEQIGDACFVATPATAGPWSPDAQHGGPPSALAARALEGHEPDPRQRLARVCIDILRPVPIGKLSLRTRMARPGRRIALVEAVMEAEGKEVLHARGWRIERPAGEVPEVTDGTPPQPVPTASHGLPPEVFASQDRGYLSMIEWRFTASAVTADSLEQTEPAGHAARQPAPGQRARHRAAWARPRIPLLAGEQPSPMVRTLLVADSGSGVGAVLPSSEFIFINVDLTVVLRRDPAGQWLLLDASTVVGADGTGLATTRLADERGSFGQGTQTLLVAPAAGRQSSSLPC